MTDQYIELDAAIAALTKVSLDFGITGIPQIMIAAKDAILALPTYPAPQVAVKPLRWRLDGGGERYGAGYSARLADALEGLK